MAGVTQVLPAGQWRPTEWRATGPVTGGWAGARPASDQLGYAPGARIRGRWLGIGSGGANPQVWSLPATTGR
ncbi:hypothetical protein PSA01_16350 [Pseudonocardia saturnea]|uniref:Uncharacterized protein n=1 Tax=Pseudonocardia saturnea TaxID=33909 RepID=A0ABQ0RVD4_9PSEU|nr:hypothetical protein Pdca_45570 [Pseudonocardia autotrophica]GEC24606.1 hypothetical protein PSA01_16350 [Pseudonocardia saturnea]